MEGMNTILSMNSKSHTFNLFNLKCFRYIVINNGDSDIMPMSNKFRLPSPNVYASEVENATIMTINEKYVRVIFSCLAVIMRLLTLQYILMTTMRKIIIAKTIGLSTYHLCQKIK